MRTATWVLGYHGCDRDVGEDVLKGRITLRASENPWDWLGTGIYLLKVIHCIQERDFTKKHTSSFVFDGRLRYSVTSAYAMPK